MTSLNISLPEALKNYVETQVASGDWGTPSEYVRELIRQDKERRLRNLEQDLLASVKGKKSSFPWLRCARKALSERFASGRAGEKAAHRPDRCCRHRHSGAGGPMRATRRPKAGKALGECGHCHLAAHRRKDNFVRKAEQNGCTVASARGSHSRRKRL